MPQSVRYDMRGPDDLIFGLGSGCEGAMDVLLQRLDAAGDWQPMARLAHAWRAQQSSALLLVVSSNDAALPAGAGLFDDPPATFGGAASTAALRAIAARLGTAADGTQLLREALPGIDLLRLVQPPPAQLLLLGAGPDAQPVAELAMFLGWRVTVVDHRSSYARPERFPGAAQVLDGGAGAIAPLLAAAPAPGIAAAVIMSHHLATDLAYLRVLSRSAVPYVGLLGPPVRRDRLLADLGEEAADLRSRLRAPIGLDLGAATPESIALAIVAEIQASFSGRESMGP